MIILVETALSKMMKVTFFVLFCFVFFLNREEIKFKFDINLKKKPIFLSFFR